MSRILVSLLCVLLALPTFAASPLEQLLPEWWKAAEAKAEQVPEEERRPLERSIVLERYSDTPTWLQTMLFAIALRPQDVRGSYNLIYQARYFRATVLANHALDMTYADEDANAAVAFVDDLYRRHSGIDSRRAMDWQSGRAELYLNLGRYDEALALQRQLVAAHDADAYDRILLAVLEKIAGNDEPFAQVIAECADDPEGISEPARYCWDVARSIAKRVVTRAEERAPAAITDILAGRGTAAKQTWAQRMHGLTLLAPRDFARAQPELQGVLGAADAPDFVKDDAMYLLATEGRSSQPPATTISMVDCYFARRNAAFPLLPDDAWEQLRTLTSDAPAPQVASHDSGGCIQHHASGREPLDLTHDCVAVLLLIRGNAAANSGDQAVLRDTAERMLALSIAQKRRIDGLDHVLERAAEVKVNGKEDLRAMQYVAAVVPRSGTMDDHIEEAARKQTARVLTPWDSPTTVASRAATNCAP